MLTPVTLFKALADDTRLRALLLIRAEGELCVCELVAALDLSQPKISRHLAQLRTLGLLADRRQGPWVYYRLDPTLPGWAEALLGNAHTGAEAQLTLDQLRLNRMGLRPQRQGRCCGTDNG